MGNFTLERATWQRPEEMHTRRPVYYVATKNGAQRPGQPCRAAMCVNHLHRQQWLVSRECPGGHMCVCVSSVRAHAPSSSRYRC